MRKVLYAFKNNNKCVVVHFEEKDELDLANQYVYEKYGEENIEGQFFAIFWEDIQYIIEKNNYELIEEKYMS